MAMPADITTDPEQELWMNGPCLTDQTTAMKITNSGAKMIGWRMKSVQETRYDFTPKEGGLAGKAMLMVGIVVHPFPFKPDAPNTDTITIEWVDAPEGQTVYDAEWFNKGMVVRRKLMNVNFNP